jgi:phytoene dehydrogenase-like protein
MAMPHGKSDARYDVVVVGAGPNGLAAAIVAARAGLSVLVFESQESCGGAVRSAELTLPGFTHDICSAVYPLAGSRPTLHPADIEPLLDADQRRLHLLVFNPAGRRSPRYVRLLRRRNRPEKITDRLKR